MKPTDIQIIGEEMAIKWDNGDESFIRLAKLRKACPCAGCKGEMDVMGNLYKGPDRAMLNVANYGALVSERDARRGLLHET